MPSNADHPQRKPSRCNRTIRQKQHDLEPRNHSTGITYRVLEYHQYHTGFENTQVEIADAIDCSDTTVSDLIDEYVKKGLNSAIGVVALEYGFQVSRRQVRGYWRISVEPYRVRPIYLDPDAYAEVEYTFSVDNRLMIENPEDFFAEIKATVRKDRPSLEGLSTDQQLNADAAYSGWDEDAGGYQ